MTNDGQETSEEEITTVEAGSNGKQPGGIAETYDATEEIPDASRVQEAGSVNSFYGVAVMIPCDTSRGGCGALIKLTHADAMNGAAQGITFRVECPRCEATVTSRPHPGSPVVARLGNRKQRRARGKVIG